MATKIKYTIETSWAHGGYSGEIELDDEDLAGVDDAERERTIERAVEEAVNNDVSWGWEEL